MTKKYYGQASGIILVYDVCEPQSFANLEYWVKKIKESAYKNVEILLLGNKKDLVNDRLVPEDDERERGIAAGLKFDYVYSADELVASDNTFFVATGVTDGELVRGVRPEGKWLRTESVIFRSRSGTVRRVNSDYLAERWLD